MTKKMIITIDVETGSVDSVTDENGDKAKTRNKPTPHDPIVEGSIVGNSNMSVMTTKTNPTCTWVFINDKWYYICS
jgi:hypothetical protein